MPHHVVCHDTYSGCFRTLRYYNEREAFRIVVGRSLVMKALLAVQKQTLQGYSSLLLIQWFRVCASVGQEWGYRAFVSSCSPRWVYCLLTDVGQSSYIRTDAWPANTHKQEEDVANTHTQTQNNKQKLSSVHMRGPLRFGLMHVGMHADPLHTHIWQRVTQNDLLSCSDIM